MHRVETECRGTAGHESFAGEERYEELEALLDNEVIGDSLFDVVWWLRVRTWGLVGEERMIVMETVAAQDTGVFFTDARPVMNGSATPELFAEVELHPSAEGAWVILTVLEDPHCP